ncbi:MAG: ABC transporter ATP-binding protein [Planctomycetota bacterium]|nr:ABC transporter ATP-binding protein [Planctomycetota bacterium]
MFDKLMGFVIGSIVGTSRVLVKLLPLPDSLVSDLDANLNWLKKFWRHYPVRLIAIAAITPVNAVLTFAFPYLLRDIVNDMEGAIKAGVTPEYFWPIATLFIVGLATVLTYILLQSQRAYVNLNLEWRIRSTVYRRITGMGNRFFTKFRTGDVITRFTDDLDKVSFFACSQIFRSYEAVLYIAAGTAFMYVLNPVLATAALVPLPLFAVVLAKTDMRLMKLFDRLQKLISRVNNHLEVCFSGVRVLRTYRKENQQIVSFASIAEDRKQQEVRTAATHVFVENIYMSIPNITMFVILVLGGYYVMEGTFDSGSFVSFMFCLMFTAPKIFEMGWIAINGRRAFVSAGRIRELESTEPDVRDRDSAQRLSKFERGIVQLSTTSPSTITARRRRRSSTRVRFSAPKGSTTAFVGPVGSGKTTLAGLIPRLYDATEGSIRIDGKDIRTFSIRDVRDHIGLVPQEAVMFSDSIRNNIIFGRDDISEEDVQWAIRVSQFANDLRAFPEGLDTMVGHRGMTLSGGQKQRLAIARAIAGRPSILILDDCSSALDAETEALLWLALEKELPDATIFVISHRIASFQLRLTGSSYSKTANKWGWELTNSF